MQNDDMEMFIKLLVVHIVWLDTELFVSDGRWKVVLTAF